MPHYCNSLRRLLHCSSLHASEPVAPRPFPSSIPKTPEPGMNVNSIPQSINDLWTFLYVWMDRLLDLPIFKVLNGPP